LTATPFGGLALSSFAAGGALRLWPVFILCGRFSGLVAIQPGHSLVTAGIYSAIRHPSYFGLFVNSLGWGLAFRSGIGVLPAARLILPVRARIGAEENLLRVQYGAEYDDYRARTSRLIPRVYETRLITTGAAWCRFAGCASPTGMLQSNAHSQGANPVSGKTANSSRRRRSGSAITSIWAIFR
jgi:isoprenylcysteine carboxyl methyltransferase (ICMT) family protein